MNFAAFMAFSFITFLHVLLVIFVIIVYMAVCWPGSSVGIATQYEVDSPGSNPGGDEIFRPSRPALGPIQPPVQWVQEVGWVPQSGRKKNYLAPDGIRTSDRPAYILVTILTKLSLLLYKYYLSNTTRSIYMYVCIYRMSQEECAKFRESVP